MNLYWCTYRMIWIALMWMEEEAGAMVPDPLRMTARVWLFLSKAASSWSAAEVVEVLTDGQATEGHHGHVGSGGERFFLSAGADNWSPRMYVFDLKSHMHHTQCTQLSPNIPHFIKVTNGIIRSSSDKFPDHWLTSGNSHIYYFSLAWCMFTS